MTDEFRSYRGIHSPHFVINHQEGYVRGPRHTNNIENAWRVFKNSIEKVYVSVDPHNLHRYAAETMFRQNNNAMTTLEKVEMVVRLLVRDKLEYKALITDRDRYEELANVQD